MTKKIYDLIIIGGGPAGLTAGIYASRARLDTLLFEAKLIGGQATTTDRIANYPGFPEITSGLELTERMKEQAQKFDLKIVQEEVTKIQWEEKKIITKSNQYQTKSIIVATGAEQKNLRVPGEMEFLGRGVSFCATCDGPFFKDKQVIVVGGGDAAITEALHLTKFAKKVIAIHRREELRAAKILQEEMQANEKIYSLGGYVVERIEGKERVEKVLAENVETGKIKEIPADGIFISIGTSPKTEFLRGMVEMDEEGYIITDKNMQTSVSGIFAAGDVRQKLLRQIATAVGDGATAAKAVEEYLKQIC
ncbi:MAG: thioredoxin-disulfide reductase [Candidatus Edwardsbacteria bacterium]